MKTILSYLLTALIGAILVAGWIYLKPSLITKENVVLTKEIKNAERQVSDLEKKKNELEKHGASKKITKDPIEYWLKH